MEAQDFHREDVKRQEVKATGLPRSGSENWQCYIYHILLVEAAIEPARGGKGRWTPLLSGRNDNDFMVIYNLPP